MPDMYPFSAVGIVLNIRNGSRLGHHPEQRGS